MRAAFRGRVIVFGIALVAAGCGRSDIDDEWEDETYGSGSGGKLGAGAAARSGRPSSGASAGKAGRGGRGGGGTAMVGGGRAGRGGAGGRGGRGGGRGGTGGASGGVGASAGFGAVGGFGGLAGVAGGGTGGVGAICGDGVLTPGELCDDGNRASGDGCSADCSKATCLVPITHKTIQSALEDMKCSTIWIADGKYFESLMIQRDVRIVGRPLDRVVISGNNLNSVVTITSGNVELESLVILEGRSSVAGAGIWNQGTLTVKSSRIRSNVAAGPSARGAGIYSLGNVVLDDTDVEFNSVKGGEPSGSEAPLVMGGGVYVVGATLELREGCEIHDNTTEMDRDAVSAGEGTARGGGIFASGSSIVLRDGSRVHSNYVVAESPSADLHAGGGGIFLENSELELESGCDVSSNRIWIDATSGTALGGGIHATGNSSIELRGTTWVRTNAVLASRSATTGPVRVAGGGIYATGDVVLHGTEMQIHDNEISSAGIDAQALGAGIAIEATSANANIELRFRDSRIAGNIARASSAQGGGLYLATAATGDKIIADLERTTGIANRALGSSAFGGFAAIEVAGPQASVTLRITNSTIADNWASADVSGGTRWVGGAFSASLLGGMATLRLDLSSATLSNNYAGTGGGALRLHAVNASAGTLAILRNTLIWGNTAGEDPQECLLEGTLLSEGYNLYSASSGCSPDGDTSLDVLTNDALLSPPDYNGGLAETSRLAETSPAVDAGDPDGCRDAHGELLETDQRTLPRDGRCDIGAFELQR